MKVGYFCSKNLTPFFATEFLRWKYSLILADSGCQLSSIFISSRKTSRQDEQKRVKKLIWSNLGENNPKKVTSVLPVRIMSTTLGLGVQTAHRLAEFVKKRKTAQNGSISHYPTSMGLRIQILSGFPFDHSFPVDGERFLTIVQQLNILLHRQITNTFASG